jgi:hypothetical protein
MSNSFNRMPTYQEPLETGDLVVSKNGRAKQPPTTRGWYTFWSGLFAGQPTGPVAVIAVGPSPFTYLAPVGGSVIVQGGTTTQIQFTRGDGNFYVVGTTAGMFPVAQGDSLVVTYSLGPPTAVFVPR